ncbi:hypothetical protein Ancab_010615 [Ancistrocladus abbreviatus]
MQRLAGLFSYQVHPLGGMLVLLIMSILDYVFLSDLSSQSGTLSPAKYLPTPMKLIQDNSSSMVNPRMEDDLSHLQTKKDGLVARKMAKSLTPVEEQTKVGEKVLPYGQRCSGSSPFSTDLEAVQSRFFADLPSLTFQSVLGLSALLDHEVLDL